MGNIKSSVSEDALKRIEAALWFWDIKYPKVREAYDTIVTALIEAENG